MVFFVLVSLPVGAGVSMNAVSASTSISDQGPTSLQSPVGSESIANYSLKQLDSPERHMIEEVNVDVGAALAMEYRESRTELDLHVLEHEFTATESTTPSSLAETASAVEERAHELEAREQETRTEFLSDQITTNQYLREVSFIASEAKLLEAFIADLEPLVEEAEDQDRTSSQLATANGVVKGLSGPIRDRLVNQHRGGISPNQVFVSVEQSGVLFASIRGDEFDRELYRAGDRSNGRDSDVGLIEAVSQFQDEYPGVAQAESGMDIGSVGSSDRAIITFRVQVPEGEMMLFYEQSTEKFYYESSNWALDRVELDPGTLIVEEDIRIEVNESFVGGPLRIVTRDNETREIVPATVQIGDSQVARTGSDGIAWGIVPAGDYSVTVETETGDVTVTIPSSRFA